MKATTAVALAALGSGLPSSVVTLARRRNVLDSTRAAGTMLVGESSSLTARLVAGVGVHVAISTVWGALLWRSLPARNTAAWGAVAGLGIAAVDLGTVGRRVAAIRDLPLAPQLADHVAFGLIIGLCRAHGHRDGRIDSLHGTTNVTGTLAGL